MGEKYEGMMKELEEIIIQLGGDGVSCRVVGRNEFTEWLAADTNEDYLPQEFTRIPSDMFATLEGAMSPLELEKISEYQCEGKVLLFWSRDTVTWSHDDKHRICSAYYDGKVDRTFVGQLYRYMCEMRLIFQLEFRRKDFAKVGVDFSFANERDNCGKIVGTVCTMTGYEELEHTTPCKVNSDNMTLLFEWLLERECIERANEILMCYREKGIHYERKECVGRPQYVLGMQRKYFYTIPVAPGSDLDDICYPDVRGVEKMEKLLAEKIRVDAQNASAEESPAQEAETPEGAKEADELNNG